MNGQLPLHLVPRPRLGLDDWLPGENHQALASLRQLLEPGGPPQLFLSGPPGSGRTHLLLGLCGLAEAGGLRAAYLPLGQAATLAPEMLEGLEQLDLIAMDDVQAIAGDAPWEEALFHLYNRAREAGCRRLFAADRGPAALPLALPDLRTRLAWGLSYQLRPLDDAGKRELLAREAGRRGLELPEEVARYIVARHRRDTASLLALLERLDHDSLVAKRPLTLPFVRERLAAAGG